jgi:hypothetical protein
VGVHDIDPPIADDAAKRCQDPPIERIAFLDLDEVDARLDGGWRLRKGPLASVPQIADRDRKAAAIGSDGAAEDRPFRPAALTRRASELEDANDSSISSS